MTMNESIGSVILPIYKLSHSTNFPHPIDAEIDFKIKRHMVR